MKGKASIKTISELTGFSSATVSNALRNKRGVSRETVEIILKAARETGYLSESRVESIRLVIYKAGGEVVNDSPFFASLIAGVEEESVCGLCGGCALYDLLYHHRLCRQ